MSFAPNILLIVLQILTLTVTYCWYSKGHLEQNNQLKCITVIIRMLQKYHIYSVSEGLKIFYFKTKLPHLSVHT